MGDARVTPFRSVPFSLDNGKFKIPPPHAYPKPDSDAWKALPHAPRRLLHINANGQQIEELFNRSLSYVQIKWLMGAATSEKEYIPPDLVISGRKHHHYKRLKKQAKKDRIPFEELLRKDFVETEYTDQDEWAQWISDNEYDAAAYKKKLKPGAKPQEAALKKPIVYPKPPPFNYKLLQNPELDSEGNYIHLPNHLSAVLHSPEDLVNKEKFLVRMRRNNLATDMRLKYITEICGEAADVGLLGDVKSESIDKQLQQLLD